MQTELKPLFTLTIGEFIAMTRKLVEETVQEKLQGEQVHAKGEHDEQGTLSIRELMAFLRCSKASVHNYKNLGLPFYRVGRKVLFRKNEVLEFMKTLRARVKRR
ncbi:MAG: helix-turn-helix domain-containing protein [Bacteroidia bacterium]